MSNFAILRTAKIKSRGKIAAADAHNKRTWQPNNARPDGEILSLLSSEKTALSAFNDILEKHDINPRKNAVLAIEYVVTFSPEAQKDINLDDWVKSNREFFYEKHGENIISMDLHLDESTPHIHILTVPIVEKMVHKKLKNRLSCRDFLGGKEKMIELQDEYAEVMKTHGLSRGVRGSAAHNRTIKVFYKDIAKELALANSSVTEALDDANYDGKISTLNYKEVFSGLRDQYKKLARRLGRALGRIDNLTERNDELTKQVRFFKRKSSDANVENLQENLQESNERIADLELSLRDKKVNNNSKIERLESELGDKNSHIELQNKVIDRYQQGQALDK